MKRLVAVLATAILAMALGVCPALAAGPQRYHDTIVFSDTIDCVTFNPAWNFNDDFVDFYDVRGQAFTDGSGTVVSAVEHIEHHSNDVNSLTGFTLHEHNNFVARYDFVTGTVTLSGAINIMQRPGAGEVIHNSGHKVLDLETGAPIVERGPSMAGDIDFCAAVAP
jgi:hypothetical protein